MILLWDYRYDAAFAWYFEVSDFDFDLLFRIGDEVQAARFSQSQVIGTGFVVEMTFFRRDRNAICKKMQNFGFKVKISVYYIKMVQC